MSAPRFVVLEGIEHGNRFYCVNREGDDPTKSATGETWYRVLGYANTSEEALALIYPTPADQIRAENEYLLGILQRMETRLPR